MANDLNNKNIIELVQQITPLIYYLISKYRNEEEKSLCIKLEFIPNKPYLYFKRTFEINDENPLNSITEFVKDFKTEGYFITFIKHFNLQILLEDPKTEEETERTDTIESEKQEGHDGPVSLHWLIRDIHSYQTLHYLGIGLKHKTL